MKKNLGFCLKAIGLSCAQLMKKILRTVAVEINKKSVNTVFTVISTNKSGTFLVKSDELRFLIKRYFVFSQPQWLLKKGGEYEFLVNEKDGTVYPKEVVLLQRFAVTA